MNHLLQDSSPSTATSLLQRANTGDLQAWNRIVQLYGPIVYRWVRRMGFQSADCADLVQDTMTSVYRKLSSFKLDSVDGSFRGWLWTIARNKANDQLRRNQKLSMQTMESMDSVALANTDRDDSSMTNRADFFNEPPVDANTDHKMVVAAALELIRKRVDPATWKAFWWTTVDGRRPDDVAIELDLSRWSVYKARSRVLHHLRTELQGIAPCDEL